jgi:hypothetical protein
MFALAMITGKFLVWPEPKLKAEAAEVRGGVCVEFQSRIPSSFWIFDII